MISLSLCSQLIKKSPLTLAKSTVKKLIQIVQYLHPFKLRSLRGVKMERHNLTSAVPVLFILVGELQA